MPENVSISVNGQSRVPPGFRFHPTEEELLQHYLRKKVTFERIDLDVIVEVDLNKLEPWDIQEKCKIGSTPQNDWYFFSHKDKKYPTGTRTNRATRAGFWKATGRDKVIYGSGSRIGMRKTLVFYKGRAPHGQKTDWIMHEYRLDDNGKHHTTNLPNVVPALAAAGAGGEIGQEEGWVVCRIFKKKHLYKSLGRGPNSPNSSAMSVSEFTETPYPTSMLSPPSSEDREGALEQIFQHMERNPRNTVNNNNQTTLENGKFMKLPNLESPNTNTQICDGYYNLAINSEIEGNEEVADWAMIDRLLTAHLNQQHQQSTVVGDSLGFCSGDHQEDDHGRQPCLPMMRSSSFSSSSSSYYVQPATQDYYSGGEIELWSLINRSSFSKSSSGPLM